MSDGFTSVDVDVSRGEQRWDVFISAQGRDFAAAEDIRAEIEGWGLTAFFCETTAAELGTTYFTRMVYDALEKANHLLFVASEPPIRGAAAVSGWCRAEIDSFLNERHSGRKHGNLCTLLLESMTVDRLPIELRASLALPRSRLQDFRPHLKTRGEAGRGLERNLPPTADDRPVFAHPLHAYPLGPMVPFEKVPPGLPSHCAKVYGDPVQADLALKRANFERREADPEGNPERQCVLAEEIPHPSQGALAYWKQAIFIACVKSPRMVGAIVEDLDLDLIPQPLRAQVERFREWLRQPR